jgi:hypothetical protein
VSVVGSVTGDNALTVALVNHCTDVGAADGGESAGAGTGAGTGAGSGVGGGGGATAGPAGAVVGPDTTDEQLAELLVMEIARVIEQEPSAVSRYGTAWVRCLVVGEAEPRHAACTCAASRSACLQSLGLDSMAMHSLSGALQHRFHLVVTQQQLFQPTTSVNWIVANRAPLSQQRILDDGSVQPPTASFVDVPGDAVAVGAGAAAVGGATAAVGGVAAAPPGQHTMVARPPRRRGFCETKCPCCVCCY